MAKERRLGPRKRLPLEVMLDHQRLGLQRCQTRDVSLDGVFVESGKLALRRNTIGAENSRRRQDQALSDPSQGCQRAPAWSKVYISHPR